MSVVFAVALRACCVAVLLGLTVARAAEPQSPLIGATREQVLTRYGEPKSQLSAGSKEVLFYPREKITLRDNVVIEVESLVAEPAKRPGGEAPSSPSTSTTNPPGATTPGPSDSGKNTPTNPATTTPGATPPSTTPPPEPKFEIKLVRPPSAKDGHPATTIPPSSTPSGTTKSTAPSSEQSKTSTPATGPTVSPEPTPTPEPAVPEVSEAEAKKKALQEQKAREREEKREKEKKEKAMRDARRRLDEAAEGDLTEDLISGRTYLFGAIAVVGGLVFLVWRYRQRQLELAATSVSSTPLAAPPPSTAPKNDNEFTTDLLEGLEWKRFEEVVASYYNKTGVVALRTKTGPATPVHLKISWKGESRPFAYVQCILHPHGLIEAKPLHDFQTVLAADGIRRGYIVTTGKFSVGARDFAEEKHITLMPGDIFVEKLNALPAMARAEIMQTLRGAAGAGAE